MSSVRKRPNELTTLKVDDTTLTDDLDIAETMKSYFSTVFATEDHANFLDYYNIVDLKLSKLISIVTPIWFVTYSGTQSKQIPWA